LIIYGILSVILELLKFLFGWVQLPEFPDALTVYIDQMLGIIHDALPLVWCFFDKSVVYTCLVIALACVNFDKLYDFTMWILAKLPIGISKE
jgi:hypothetical protein